MISCHRLVKRKKRSKQEQFLIDVYVHYCTHCTCCLVPGAKASLRRDGAANEFHTDYFLVITHIRVQLGK